MTLGRFVAGPLYWFRLLARSDFLARRVPDMPAPAAMRPGELFVVGPRRNPKWATFLCPSGCGTPLLLSLSAGKRPRWSVALDWLARPSLAPSVRRTDGCRCHFWLRRGSIEWCRDTGK